MVPTITPPTDNLYKFISLFGLTIFLFSSYNLGIVFDRSTQVKMELEDLKVNVIKKIYTEKSIINPRLVSNDPTVGRNKPIKVNKLIKDLQEVKDEIKDAKLTDLITIELNAKVSKMRLILDSIQLKLYTCISFVVIGLFVMIFGFLRWKKRDQDIRDKMLEIEHILKQQERDMSQQRKKKTILSSSLEQEKQHSENEDELNQNSEITSANMN